MPEVDGELDKSRRDELPKMLHHIFTIRTTQAVPMGVTEEESYAACWERIMTALLNEGIYSVLEDGRGGNRSVA
jgi:hypothetical protein